MKSSGYSAPRAGGNVGQGDPVRPHTPEASKGLSCQTRRGSLAAQPFIMIDNHMLTVDSSASDRARKPGMAVAHSRSPELASAVDWPCRRRQPPPLTHSISPRAGITVVCPRFLTLRLAHGRRPAWRRHPSLSGNAGTPGAGMLCAAVLPEKFHIHLDSPIIWQSVTFGCVVFKKHVVVSRNPVIRFCPEGAQQFVHILRFE